MAKVLLVTNDRAIQPVVEGVLIGLGLEWRTVNTSFEAACAVVQEESENSPFNVFLVDEYLCESDNSYDPGSSFARSIFVAVGQVINLTRYSTQGHYQAPKEDPRFVTILERLLPMAISRVD